MTNKEYFKNTLENFRLLGLEWVVDADKNEPVPYAEATGNYIVKWEDLLKWLDMEHIEPSKVDRITKTREILEFTLTTGEKVGAMPVKTEGNKTTYVFIDCLKKEYPMYEDDDSHGYGDYEASDLRNTLNTEILDTFPAELRSKMVKFNSGDYLRLPTEYEIFGTNEYAEENESDVEQWGYMKDRRNRIAFGGYKSNEWRWYWLSNKYSASDFCFVSSNGYANYSAASYSAGVRPAFCLVQA